MATDADRQWWADEEIAHLKEHEFMEACRDLVLRFAGNHAYGQPCAARDDAQALLKKFGKVTDNS